MAIENSAVIGGEELLRLAEERMREMSEMPKDTSHRNGETREVIEKLAIESQGRGIIIGVRELRESMVQSPSIETNNRRSPVPGRRFPRRNWRPHRLV